MHLPSRCNDVDINTLSLPMMRQAIMYCYEPQRFLQRPPPPSPHLLSLPTFTFSTPSHLPHLSRSLIRALPPSFVVPPPPLFSLSGAAICIRHMHTLSGRNDGLCLHDRTRKDAVKFKCNASNPPS
jgi:hypothetical protein